MIRKRKRYNKNINFFNFLDKFIYRTEIIDVRNHGYSCLEICLDETNLFLNLMKEWFKIKENLKITTHKYRNLTISSCFEYNIPDENNINSKTITGFRFVEL